MTEKMKHLLVIVATLGKVVDDMNKKDKKILLKLKAANFLPFFYRLKEELKKIPIVDQGPGEPFDSLLKLSVCYPDDDNPNQLVNDLQWLIDNGYINGLDDLSLTKKAVYYLDNLLQHIDDQNLYSLNTLIAATGIILGKFSRQELMQLFPHMP